MELNQYSYRSFGRCVSLGDGRMELYFNAQASFFH